MATNSSFKLHKEFKRMVSSGPIEMRSITKKLFLEANEAYNQGKNRKFSDPATAQKGGNKNPSPPIRKE
jgi:hypothetical protein